MSDVQPVVSTPNHNYPSFAIDPLLLDSEGCSSGHHSRTLHLPNSADVFSVHQRPTVCSLSPSPSYGEASSQPTTSHLSAIAQTALETSPPCAPAHPEPAHASSSAQKRPRTASDREERVSTPKRFRVTSVSQIQGQFSKLSVVGLKELCRERGLRVSGRKPELVARLEQHEQGSSSTRKEAERSEELVPPSLPVLPCAAPSEPLTETDLNEAFTRGYAGCEEAADQQEDDEGCADDDENDDGDEGRNQCGVDLDEIPAASVNPKASETNKWIDQYILNTRRESGKKTEVSVLRTWQRWLTGAIMAGTVPDGIIDAQHTMEYLKYSATRALLTRKGSESSGGRQLTASSLKKISVMLGRVRRRQEEDDPSLVSKRPAQSSRLTDFYKSVQVQAQRRRFDYDDFDVTENTILDFELLPLHFEQVQDVILTEIKQLPTIIKALFAWNWQCATLNRGDELVNLPLGCLQPYQVHISEYTTADGRRSGYGRRFFGVLSLFHESKVTKPGKSEPDYSFILPHRLPLRCAIGALTLMLWFIFDDRKLMSEAPGWDWSCASTWRKTKVMFGKRVGVECKPDTLRSTYTTIFDKTNINCSKKLHLARRALPTELENKGVSADAIDKIGHWQGGTRQEVYASKIPTTAVTALAGFYVGEQYNVPWATVDVPDELQMQVFPFVESALANIRTTAATGKVNHGTINFLELLQQLRPFFWRMMASIKARYPDSLLFERLKGPASILNSDLAKQYLAEWPAKLQAKLDEAEEARVRSFTFSEAATQSAFVSLSMRHHESHKETATHFAKLGAQLERLERRTDYLSPSKAVNTRHPRRHLSLCDSSDEDDNEELPRLPVDGRHDTTHAPRACHVSHGPPITPARLGRSPLPSSGSPPSMASLMPAQSPSTACTTPLTPATMLPALPTPPSPLRTLVPRHVCSSTRTYTVLPLAHGVNPPSTHADLILPQPVAFQDRKSARRGGAPPAYPVFTSETGTWEQVLRQILQPEHMWECWAPRSLGSYDSVRALWQAWEHGSIIEGVGCTPPLRLIDSEWGTRIKDVSKGITKGKQQLWRPQSAQARKQWNLFEFFVKRVQTVIGSGKTASAAVDALDEERGTRTLSTFHRDLQPKKGSRKDRKQAGCAPSAVASSTSSVVSRSSTPPPALLLSPSTQPLGSSTNRSISLSSLEGIPNTIPF